MPVKCIFLLNSQRTSKLQCSGFGAVEAYSGQKEARDNPADTAMENIGPLPRGTYYLVDRKSGGHLGWLYDWFAEHTHLSTDHSNWFMLWNANGGDTSVINGIQRGHFRLHPEGRMRLSEGCITVVSPFAYESLRRYIHSHPANLPVPGSTLRAYGTVEVQ
jgi:hypothetical protein